MANLLRVLQEKEGFSEAEGAIADYLIIMTFTITYSSSSCYPAIMPGAWRAFLLKGILNKDVTKSGIFVILRGE